VIRQVKKFLAIVTLLTFPSVVATHAQEVACDIDLSGVVTQLVQAQAAASGGDTDAGLEQMAGVRAALAEITAACTEAGIEAGVALDNRFVAPNGTFSVNYPAGWVEGTFSPNPSGGAVFLGNSQTAAEALNTTIPQVLSGEQALAVAVGTADLLGVAGENPSLEAVLRGFAERSLTQFTTTSELEMSSLDDRAVGRMEFGGETFEAVLVGIRLEDSDLYALVVAVAASGELDAVRPVADAVALSVG
jgi:hypothetical protein